MPITKATSNVIAPITATGSTTARSLPDRFADVVNVKDFGAKGDGVTDDTAAIQAANNSGAYAITFPAGIYLANNINMNTSWQMADGAFIKYNGSSYSDYIVRCSGNDLFGNLNIDANAASPELMLHVTGTRNTFSRIAVRNLSSVASANVSGAVKISGVGNEIGEIVGRNLLNTGQSNASSPQLLTFAGGSDANIVGSVRGLNVRSGVVCVGTGSNSVQSIDLDGAGDNGIYNTSGKLSVGTIRYKGEDEPIVVIGGDLNIGDAIIDSGFNSAVAVDNCNDVYIGNLIIKDSNIKGLFKNRDVNTCKSLSIGRIMGD
jgi:polygalacturonase